MTTDYTALIERLEAAHPNSTQYSLGSTIFAEAASALRALQAKLAKRDALRQRLKAAEKDAERLDWWQDKGSGCKISPPSLGFEWSAVVPGRSVYGKTLRDVIDAAINAYRGSKP